jgi:hypothetical protein
VNDVFSGSFLVGSYTSESLLFLSTSLLLTPSRSVSLLAVLMLTVCMLDILRQTVRFGLRSYDIGTSLS